MTTFYVDQTTGDDADTGLTEALAWKTIAKVNGATFAGDDSCLFKCGEVWRETLNPHDSGTIGHQVTYGSYGTGDKPKILGSTQISTWADETGNHWSATCATAPVQVWFVAPSTGTRTSGDKKTYSDLSELINEYDWCHNGTTLYVYAASDPDTRYASVEAGARDYCINTTANKNYITIDGLEFGFANSHGLYQFYDSDSLAWVIQNCTVYNSDIIVFGASTIIQDNVIDGYGPGQTADGAIRVVHADAVNVIVRRNTISNYLGRGIWFSSGCGASFVQDNIIHDIEYSYGGAEEGYGIDIDGESSPITGFVTCTGNTIYDCARWGIFLENCSEGSDVSKNLIHGLPDSGIRFANTFAEVGKNIGARASYNIIYETGNGVDILNASGIDIWNNVFDAGNVGLSVAVQLAGTSAYMVDIDIRNNIFGSGWDIFARTPSSDWTVNFVFDYNCVEDIGAVIREDTGPEEWSLAELQAASKALHCFTTAPGFVDAAGHNYHLLATSPCINAGVDVGLTEDFEGNQVDSLPDIGAYEYTSTELVVADGSHAHGADSPVLTQAHTLAPADAMHGHDAEVPVLGQAHILVVQNATHGQIADAPTLAQAHLLAVAEALHAQSVDSPALIQAYVLALLDALHDHTVDPIILSQAHTLVVADGHHTHIAGAPVVLQAIPTTWQTEADKFVNEPVVLVEIALDSGTKRLAVDFVRPDNSAPYAGRILSLPNITTSIGDLNRTYEAADIEIIIADPDRDLRTAMQTEGLKNRTLTVKLAFPNEDLAKALTIFSGRIYNYNPLDNMRFSIKAEQYVKNFSEMYPDKLITATDYPNAAEGMVELVIPIVWGTVSSATGPLKAFMVDVTEDAEKHLVGLQYGAVLTVTNVRINGTLKATPADYSIVGTDVDGDGKIHTVIEWEPGVRPTSSDLVTCDAEFLRPSALTARGPVEAFVFFAMNFCGYIFDDFDPTAYADALAIEADRGYALDGIMAERKTLAAWKDEISNEFELDIWYDTATGLIKFQYLGGALDILAAPHYKDYKDILKYTPNQQVDLIGNWCRPGYNYDYALQNFQNYQFYEDVPSQTLHGGVYRLDPTLFFVRDSGTAYDLASRKIIRQRNPIAFEKFILPLKTFSLSLGTVVRITHYDGPGPDGYDGDYFQLRRAELDPNNFVLSGEFELVANFYGDDFIFGDEDTLADDWLTASDEDKYYGYLCDETTGEFSNGDHGKAMNE